MDTKSIIELLSGIGACMAAIAAFLTIRQMSKQHKQSYRPDLTFTRTSFYGYSVDTEKNKSFPTYWYDTEVEKEKVGELEYQFGLLIYNVGLGVAKKVNVVWNFPVEDFVKDINSVSQRNLLQFYLEYKNGIISLKSNDFGELDYYWANQKKSVLDYVLPSHISSDGMFLRLPPAYLFLVSVYIYAFFQKKEDIEFYIPNITANFSYTDTGGDKHQETFELCPNIVMAMAGKFTGFFDINKKIAR